MQNPEPDHKRQSALSWWRKNFWETEAKRNPIVRIGVYLIGFTLVLLVVTLIVLLFTDIEKAGLIFFALLMCLLVFGGCFLLGAAANRAQATNQKPPTWRFILAFFGLCPLLMILGTLLVPDMRGIGAETAPSTYYILIAMSVPLLFPLLLYIIRGGKPPTGPKPAWWRVALLWIGVYLALPLLIPLFQPPGGDVKLGPILIYAAVCVALMLPYFLRRRH